jgi:putative oxidoreductase
MVRAAGGPAMKALLRLIEHVHGWFVKAMNLLQSPFLLAVRLYWGWQLWQTGAGKLHDISKPIEYFTSLGIPHPVFNAYFVGWLEAVGGILLILGLGSRIIAVPLIVDMLVAYVTADREALTAIFSDPGKFYAADEYTFLFAALLVLIFGPGKLSLDTLIAWWRKKKTISDKQ